MEAHLNFIGGLLIALALVHGIFPKYFNWAKELKHLSLINHQMMEIHTFFVALIVFLMGVLCLTSANELVTTSLGKKISIGMGIFWLFRLVVQFFGYSVKLWKGKVFETGVHIVFALLWTYLSVVFVVIWMS